MNNMVLYFNSCGQVYYHSIVIALAVLLGGIAAVKLASMQGEKTAKLSRYVMLYSVVPALVLARAQYCMFNLNDFQNILSVLALSRGGYGLFGAIAGVVIAAVIVYKRSKGIKLANILDFLAPAGALAIAVGRLSAFFSGEELGLEIKTEALQFFPIASYSQQTDGWYMSVFAYESLAAFIIFAVTLVLYIGTYKKSRYEPGCTWLAFFLMYCGFQMLLESWRTDSLFLNTLGFVRFSQALCAIISAVICIVLCVGFTKKFGFSKMQILIWTALLVFFALAFVCEFTMTGGTTVRNYTAMAVSLAIVTSLEMFLLARVYGCSE